MPLKPRAVFLDVGWTLVHPVRSMWEVLAEVATEAGGRLSADEFEASMYRLIVSRRDVAVAQALAGTPLSDSDEEFASLFEGMGRVLFSMADVREDHGTLTRRFLQRFWTRENWRVFPDVPDAIGVLRSRGIRIGVVSNAASDLLRFLEELGLAPQLDFIVISAIEGMRKPDPRIFRRALEHAAVEPAEAVHVGDMYVEDVVGARCLGIRPFLIERGPFSMFPHHPESTSLDDPALERVASLAEAVDRIGAA